uniref:UvrD-like helicase C-terminal domain-containing protein n=1 Tax=viral metagenome TaxID=1070528 RepID=A0A6C0D1B2_9ZZZZ
MSLKYSEEQHAVVVELEKGNNVCVQAVAGSGKTTTCLHIAESFPGRNILLLTYNAKLKMETRRKVDSLGITNMEVHSFHAFCVKYFDKDGFRDHEMLKYLKKRPYPSLLRPFQYDIILLDECQDMTPLYFELVLRIIYYHSLEIPLLVTMGDTQQSIFQFNRADSRFLTLSLDIFPNSTSFGSLRLWSYLTLRTTYRLTNPMIDFLTKCCSGAPEMEGVKRAINSNINSNIKQKQRESKVQYVVCNSFSKIPFEKINKLLKTGKYTYDDIFILAPSLKSVMTPVRKLANLLTENGIPVFVPTSEEESLDEDVLRGKVVCSTFHQIKGLERKVVIVFQFDESYFQYFAKDISFTDHHRLPNTLYVALTRAKEELILIHDKKNSFIPFLRPELLPIYTTYQNNYQKEVNPSRGMIHHDLPKESKTKKERLSILEMTKYIPADILQQCMEYIQVQKLESTKEEGISFQFSTKAAQGEGYENVSEITSVAIPTYFEYFHTGTSSLTTFKKKLGNLQSKNVDRTIDRNIDPKLHISSLLEAVNEWCSQKSGYHFKKSQIVDYSWMNQQLLEDACTRLLSMLQRTTKNIKCLKYEMLWERSFHETVLYGFTDMVDLENPTGSIYELKIQTDVESIHFIQCALYLWLVNGSNRLRRPIYLLHLPTASMYSISFRPEIVCKSLLDCLWDYKFSTLGEKKVEDPFVETCQSLWKGRELLSKR